MYKQVVENSSFHCSQITPLFYSKC